MISPSSCPFKIIYSSKCTSLHRAWSPGHADCLFNVRREHFLILLHLKYVLVYPPLAISIVKHPLSRPTTHPPHHPSSGHIYSQYLIGTAKCSLSLFFAFPSFPAELSTTKTVVPNFPTAEFFTTKISLIQTFATAGPQPKTRTTRESGKSSKPIHSKRAVLRKPLS